MRPLLLLDNKDSFVWNLAQAFAHLGAPPQVLRSDRASIADIEALAPIAIVLSPGPGRPEHAGICIDTVRHFSGHLPILGVCLGHQAIGAAFGATIRRAPPCHGKPWPVLHQSTHLFQGLESPLTACRYHSLVVDEPLPEPLIADAHNPEGLLMGLHHAKHPTFGVQFHPESFRSPQGPQLLANFLEHCR